MKGKFARKVVNLGERGEITDWMDGFKGSKYAHKLFLRDETSFKKTLLAKILIKGISVPKEISHFAR